METGFVKPNGPQLNNPDNAPRSVQPLVTSNPQRIPELGRLDFQVPSVQDDERISRRIGYVLLGVTAVLAVVVFWPWLAENFA